MRGGLCLAALAVAARCTLNPLDKKGCVTTADCLSGNVCADRQCVPDQGGAGGAANADGPGGTGGGDGTGGTGGDGGPPPGGWDAPMSAGCSGSTGPAPVNIDGLFCIDSTLVTYGQYAAFLAAVAVNPPTQLPDCLNNQNFNPTSGLPASGEATDYPVTTVDFCDARAYCAWAGKRLCQGLPGNFGLGVPKAGEAYYACSGGTMNLTYAYGVAYSQSACDTPNGPPTRVGALPACTSAAYPGLTDLSGNVGFWEEMCDQEFCRNNAPPGPNDSTSYRCDVENHDNRPVEVANLGIRCCSDVVQAR
jgi:formylglycine-generating enzyme required for sulfatase activity